MFDTISVIGMDKMYMQTRGREIERWIEVSGYNITSHHLRCLQSFINYQYI